MILITYVKMDVMPGLNVWITGDEWERVRQSQGHTRNTSLLHLSLLFGSCTPRVHKQTEKHPDRASSSAIEGFFDTFHC